LDNKAHVIFLFKLWNGSKHGIHAHYLKCLNGKIVIGVLSATLENGEWTYVSVLLLIYVFNKSDDKLNKYLYCRQ